MISRPPRRKNKILEQRWNSHLRDLHLQRLASVKSRVDNGNPFQFNHIFKKCKKEQLLEDKFTEIERSNRILLERLASIMQKGKLNQSGFEGSWQASHRRERSLNGDIRRREQRRINLENEALLRRLQEKKSHYNVMKWEVENSQREKILQNMGEFRYPTSTEPPTSNEPDHTDRLASCPFMGPKRLNTADYSLESDKPMQRIKNAKITVCKRERQLDGKNYLVEISLCKGRMLVSARDLHSPESIVVEIPPEKTKEILEVFHRDYESIVDHLAISEGRLIVEAPEPSEKDIEEEKIEIS